MIKISSDFWLEKAFEDAVPASLQQSNPYFKVASVLMAGGLHPSDPDFDMGDGFALYSFVKTLIEYGVKFDRPLDVFIQNLEYEDRDIKADFLKYPSDTDMLMLAFLNVEKLPDHKVSPLALRPEVWKKAIVQSNPKIIAVVTDEFTAVGKKDVPENYTLFTSIEGAVDYNTYIRKDLQLVR